MGEVGGCALLGMLGLRGAFGLFGLDVSVVVVGVVGSAGLYLAWALCGSVGLSVPHAWSGYLWSEPRCSQNHRSHVRSRGIERQCREAGDRHRASVQDERGERDQRRRHRSRDRDIQS